jgi:hypothetical protein
MGAKERRRAESADRKGRTLDGVRELGREGDVSDRDVVEHEVELVCPPDEVLPHQSRDLTDARATGTRRSAKQSIDRPCVR